MTVRTSCKAGPGAEVLVRGARAVDPLAGLDQVVDVLVRKGRISAVGEGLEAPARVHVVDGEGKLLLPGFVDLHTHLRTPGREDEEDLVTASAAAAAGGYVAAVRHGQHRPRGRLGRGARRARPARRAPGRACLPASSPP